MSGFEVAGVVLGAIPLVVEALKCYSDGVRLPSRCDQDSSHVSNFFIDVDS